MSLTPYARYTFSWLDSDSVTLDNGMDYHIDSITAHGVQAGVDFDLKLTDLMAFNTGLGYMGVWNGDADSDLENISVSSPSIEGNTGFAKVGLRIAPQGSGFSCDLGATGYAGDRKGGSDSVILNYAF